MKQISIIFSKRNTFSLFSWLIMKGLKISYSHVAIKMTDGDTNQEVYYQSSSIEVNCVEEKNFLAKETIIEQYDYQIDDQVFKTGKAFAIAQLGKPYGVLAILGFALQIVLGWIGIIIGNPFRDAGQSFVCSQFVFAFIEAADSLKLDVDINNVTPKTMHDLIPQLPKVWNS